MTSRNEPAARQRRRKRAAEMGAVLARFSYIPVVRFTLNPAPAQDRAQVLEGLRIASAPGAIFGPDVDVCSWCGKTAEQQRADPEPCACTGER